MSNLLQKGSGNQPIFTNRFFLGLWTNRNPLRAPVGAMAERYGIGATDALIDGLNSELSNRLTLIRRPGNTAGLTGYITNQNLPDVANSFYSFHEITGTVRVFADCVNSIYLLPTTNIAPTPIFTKSASAGQSYFQGVGRSLFFGDGVEQKKWLDFGTGNPGNSFSTITNTGLASNNATFNSINNLSVGQTVVVSGTANGSGAFNGTWVVTYANPFAFIVTIVHADIGTSVDTGFASATWNWGIAAPPSAPTLIVTSSGAAAIPWVANTVFSTMGALVDANGNAQVMISVNATGTNSTRLGTTGSGQPTWNQTPGNTTTEGSGTPVVWVNKGPIATWAPNHLYNDASTGGTAAQPCAIYDPVTGIIALANAGGSGATSFTSGNQHPPWVAVNGATAHEDTGHGRWLIVYPPYTKWLPAHAYTQLGSVSFNDQNGAVLEPVATLPPPTGQTIYLQAATNSGTSGATANPPFSASLNAGDQTVDGDLIWECLGSATWTAAKQYTPWSATSPVFSMVKDTNGNLQVCVVGGAAGATQPLQQWQNGHVYTLGQTISDSNGAKQTVTTGGTSGGAHPVWNTTVAGTTNDNTVVWTNGGASPFWGTNYGDMTIETTGVTWRCVGPSMSWAASTQWYFPTSGFQPPTSSQPYGGAQVIGSAFVQAVIASGKSGGSAPAWPVLVNGTVVDNAATWRTIAAQSLFSLAFQKGYGYVYAYKARSVADQYSPIAGGGLGLIPPGLGTGSPNGGGFGPPTGSADGSVSTASPSVVMATAVNTGAVITVAGVGSTDPQVDTIIIFRTFDGGATYFELTEINNPAPLNGNTGAPWSFQDYLPDVAAGTLPGLNTSVVAPTAQSNNPPPVGAINLVQWLGRIFVSVGATVYCSQGPLVGGSAQPPGNGYTAFNPAQFWAFPSPVTRMVATNSALLVFTTSDLYTISGGPNVFTLFQNIHIPGLGLTSYNALTQSGGIISLITADRQCVALDPNLGVSEIGFPIGDKITAYNPVSSYVTYHIQGSNDKALYVADGSTGWYRCNPNQAPDSNLSGPVWSPKATIASSGACKAVASLEVAPGVHALLIGATSANKPVLVRDSSYTTFTDNGTAYSSTATIGNIILANPGEIAELNFITCDFVKVGTSPIVSLLLDEISGSFENISAYVGGTGIPPQDPTIIYGLTTTPATIFANRYYLGQTIGGVIPGQGGTSCRHLQIKFDFGATDTVENELYTFTIFGRLLAEI